MHHNEVSTQARIPKGERKRMASHKTPLHAALEANDVEAAAALIETTDVSGLNAVTATGTTPLMLLAMGRCSTRRSKSSAEHLIHRLLERGGGEGVARRSSSGRSAAEYAESPGEMSCEMSCNGMLPLHLASTLPSLCPCQLLSATTTL